MASKQFPLKHVSIRVPWHDNAWNGTVCAQPARNTACLKLRNIADSKSDDAEEKVADQSIKSLKQALHPPCVGERATFMADFAFSRLHEHPYAKTENPSHAHFKPTV